MIRRKIEKREERSMGVEELRSKEYGSKGRVFIVGEGNWASRKEVGEEKYGRGRV